MPSAPAASSEIRGDAPPPPVLVPPTPRFDAPTMALSAPLQDAIDALGAHKRITSAKIGAGGVASETYAAYERVVAIANPEEERALIDHPNAVVRGYLGGHLARFHASHLPELSELLRDLTPVQQQHGCMVGGGTVASYVAMTLCDAVHRQDATAEEARDLLQELAGDATSPVQAEALRCLDSLPG